MDAVHARSRRARPVVRPRLARRPATLLGLVALFIIVIMVAVPEAQPVRFVAGPPASTPDATAIDLLVGRSTVLNLDRPIERVSLTTPDIADALVTTPQQLLIHGKAPGSISLFVWDRSGGIRTYEVNVRRDLSELKLQFEQLFPGEPVAVASNGRDVVLSGAVSSKYVVEKAADVASGYVDKPENVVNLLRQQEGVASNQVLLRVRFAEVSRSALTELGASFFTGANGFHDYVSRVTTQQFPAPTFEETTRESLQGVDDWGGGRDTVTATGGKSTFSDFLNLFIFNNRYSLGTVIRALQERGLFQSLAEPNLIATNGKEASFLAGGEYPYPVIQPSSGGNAVTIVFKEFGIRLTFTPTVLGGDLVHLKVRPEVSALDFSNAITLEGFRVPALSTRRTETEVELQDGQTFAIAGLLNSTVTDTMRKVPGIGDIPILGWLFRSKAAQKQQTELVVMITPQILRRGSTGVSAGLPSLVEPFLGQPKNPLPPPAPYTGSPRYPSGGEAAGTPRREPAPSSAPVSAPAAAPDQAPDSSRAPAPDTAQPSDGAPRTFVAPAMTAVPAEPAASVAPPTPPAPALTRAETKRIEKARAEEAKRRADEEKRAAEAAKKAAKQAAKAAEEQRKREEKAAKAQAKRDAEVAKQAAKVAEEQRKREEKAAKAQTKRDAETAKQAEKEAKKKRERDATLAKEQAERAKALAEAEARLREAQAAYQAGKSPRKPGGGGAV